MKEKSIRSIAVLMVVGMVLYPKKVYAVENVMIPTENNEIISVVLPVVEESDPFSFFIDPLHIFYNTFGSSDGDITVQEDTYLLFYNCDGNGYTLSNRSDRLEIINQSTVPVKVTITAKLENVDGISVVQSQEFKNRHSCDLYLALVDNEGNEQSLSEGGEVSVTVSLDKAPIEAYAYVFCEDTGEYQNVCQTENVDFDAYSFGLMGACNESGDWTSINGKPHVTISWKVEPVVSDKSELDEKLDTVSGNVVPDENILDKNAQNTDEQSDDDSESSIKDATINKEGSVSKNEI